MKAKEMLKEIYTRFYRLVSRHKRIENASKLMEEYIEVMPCEYDTDELARQYSAQERTRSLKEEMHNLKFDHLLERFGESLAELSKLIKEEQATLKKLSTSIQQESKELQQKRKNVDLQMEWFDMLNDQLNAKTDVKEPVQSVDVLPPMKVISFEQKENLQEKERLQA
ncbi:hypothetical protein [Bartonella sp. WD16.2]|uniref:hypothetical protein n=1 Tax=Bartonella sp. WD16.2 TaxID=1933904 RepID=UPI00099AFE87|nr:hypothetical protein [Bartonella sp. WD16.2]AQX19892.1 hypothetical protein BWD162_007760 [Bartonella sp. WD16.2]